MNCQASDKCHICETSLLTWCTQSNWFWCTACKQISNVLDILGSDLVSYFHVVVLQLHIQRLHQTLRTVAYSQARTYVWLAKLRIMEQIWCQYTCTGISGRVQSTSLIHMKTTTTQLIRLLYTSLQRHSRRPIKAWAITGVESRFHLQLDLSFPEWRTRPHRGRTTVTSHRS